MDSKTYALLKFINAAPERSYAEIERFLGCELADSQEWQYVWVNHYIVYTREIPSSVPGYVTDCCVTLTPLGRGELEKHQTAIDHWLENRRFKIVHVIISVTALILSIIALVK